MITTYTIDVLDGGPAVTVAVCTTEFARLRKFILESQIMFKECEDVFDPVRDGAVDKRWGQP